MSIKMKERHILIRILTLLFGAVLIATFAEFIKVVLKQYAGVSFGGVIPALILYGIPLVILMKWAGVFKSQPTENKPTTPPSDDKWTE